MRRSLLLFIVALCLVSSTTIGHAKGAIDVKVRGQWDFVFGWANNTQHFKKGVRKDDNGIAAQRIRTQINFIASENLQGVLQFEIGDIHWGNNSKNGSNGRGAGGSVGTDGVNIETKHAYLDWMVPTTDLHIRMGLQGLALPMATDLGSPLFDDDVAAVVASYTVNDILSLTAFWARPYDYTNNDHDESDSLVLQAHDYGRSRHINDEMDMFGLMAPMQFEGINFTPWGVWANIGDGSGFIENLLENGNRPKYGVAKENSRTTAWWAGLGVAVDLWDPLTFAVDAMYGHMQAATFNLLADLPNTTGHNNYRLGAEGWFVAANLDYKLDWGKPGLFGWWASGDDYSDVKKDGMLGRMPVMTSSSAFAPTSFGFDGGFGISTDQVLGYSGTGTWGIGIQVADMNFMENLTHTIRLAYIEGTNDHKIIKNDYDEPFYGDFYLTDKDSVVEINFDHTYQVYENLTAVLELGYITMNLDRKTWAAYDADDVRGHKTDDAWKAQLNFQYKF